MTKTYARVVMDLVGGDADDRLANQLILDLLIDEETRGCVGPTPAMGYAGSLKAADYLYPFLLGKDGTLDYGACADEDEREEHLNIRDRQIVEGGYVTKVEGRESCTYRIRSVAPLG